MQRTGQLPAAGLTIDATSGVLSLPATGLLMSQMRGFIAVVDDPTDGARADLAFFLIRTGMSVYAQGFGNQALPFNGTGIPDVSKSAASYAVQVARFPASSHPCSSTAYAIDLSPTCPAGSTRAVFFTLDAAGQLVADLRLASLFANGRYCVGIVATAGAVTLQTQTFTFDLVN